MLQTDVLVIGAGPSGTVAAAIIKNAGFNVIIVEKQQFPRFVIGESLLPRCLDSIERAGLLPALEARNYQIKSGAKFVKGNQVCDFTFEHQFTEDGRKYAWQMPRADFDKTLADACEAKGITVLYQKEVIDIKIEPSGNSISTIVGTDGNKEEIKARFIVDGSGYGRVIPRLFNLEKGSTQATRKTLFSHFTDPRRLEQEEPNRIVIFVHKEKCWIWTIPFSNGITSMGFVAEPTFFDDYAKHGDLEQQLRAMIADEPNIARRFEHAELKFEPKILQGWSATTDTFYGNGFVLTGNVTEFLDPIFSSGVTLATVSAEKAGNLVVRHLKGESIDWEAEYLLPTLQGVDVFRTYVNAWYDGSLFKIFFADQKDEKVQEQICSVLAGYVWDNQNPFVKNHQKSLKNLVGLLDRN